MISYREAMEHILALPWSAGTEQVPLLEACGRVLAADVVAPWPLPRFDQSAMDGFAHRANDVPGTLDVVGESAAGDPFEGSVASGQAVRISTGAHVPADLDGITPIEHAQPSQSGSAVTIARAARSGAMIRRRGCHVGEGELLATPGTIITPAYLALLASFNLQHVTVFERPRVAIFTSGDEIQLHGEPLGAGDIVGSSLYFLLEELRACQCEPRIFGVAPDDLSSFVALFREAQEWAHIVVTTAGVSVGAHDVVHGALGELGGEAHFWRVAVRPGKPMLLATVAGTPWFGFPGNPISTACNTEIFLKPFLRKAFNIEPAEPPLQKFPLLAEFPRDSERLFFVYASLQIQEGRTAVMPLPNQDSGNQLLAAAANALVVVSPGNEPIGGGEMANVLPLSRGL